MTNNKKQFICKTKAVSRKVHGLGTAMILLEGTVQWSWEDDDGVAHIHDIPGTTVLLTFTAISGEGEARQLS
jgi:hypothetical protein